MKKVALSFFIIIVFGAYIVYRHFDSSSISFDSGTPSDQPVAMPSDTESPSSSPEASSSDAPTPSSTTKPSSFGQYKDGQYTGKVADAFYGNFQVKAIIQNGQISDIQFLQYPNDRPTSVQVSNMSMPKLKSEAIKIQNSNVDIVSGATQTSEAFQQSLASALSQAVN